MASPAKTRLVLEINLISAQGLKPPSSPRRKFQTYALTWIDSSTKLRTRVDKIGGLNPTWNDKFLFRVTPEFLASETAGVCVAIYAVVQIRRPSGRFYGVMNIGAMVVDGCDFPALEKISAIGYRDLMGEKIKDRRRKLPEMKRKVTVAGDEISSESCDNDTCCAESVDETESSTSSSSPKTTALQDWNGVRELTGNKGLAGAGFLCCLVAQRSVHALSPTTTR
ncbi:unnamed protein product [Vicia faba]|uniref:C2 domain-containing protein n=1 Tax=Vicia faba TaxID=3906 RepID=A0AAV1B4D7_VICFA|nr:unnamed protein product [Vicia faba]